MILGPDCLVVMPGAEVAETRRAWLEQCQDSLDFARKGRICQLVAMRTVELAKIGGCTWS